MNCYECKHRREIVGDAHSQCKAMEDDSRELLASIAVQTFKQPLTIGKLKVDFDPYGIRMGWCNWPINYDPLWVVSCNGFEIKDDSTTPNKLNK